MKSACALPAVLLLSFGLFSWSCNSSADSETQKEIDAGVARTGTVREPKEAAGAAPEKNAAPGRPAGKPAKTPPSRKAPPAPHVPPTPETGAAPKEETEVVPLPSGYRAPILAGAALSGPGFRIDFDGPPQPIPPGAVTGLNDLGNATPEVWNAWRTLLRPQGGLVRIWVRPANSKLGTQQFAVAREALASHLGIFLTVVGAPEHFVGWKGDAQKASAIPPESAEKWAVLVAGYVKRMEQKGFPVSFVEIWNEPDLSASWSGSKEEFAAFFAQAGKTLRSLVPASVKIGGPGLSRGSGRGMSFFESIFQACKKTGFKPDYLSWHSYSGYGNDVEAFGLPKRIRGLAARFGFAVPRFIVSEWNVGLPGGGRAPELDDERGAIHYLAQTIGIIRAGVSDSLFFLLQDGAWEAKKDFAGESVGIFTLHGAPKAVFAAMRMMRQAADFPAVPVERLAAPWNLNLLATRSGDRGYLLLSNGFGEASARARKLLELEGVKLASLGKGSEKKVRGFLEGKAAFPALGLPQSQEGAWEEARRVFQETARQRRSKEHQVRLALSSPPVRIGTVRLLDHDHGNPGGSPAFLKAFARSRESDHEKAVDYAMERLRQLRLGSGDLTLLEEALRKKDRKALHAVDATVATRAEAFYKEGLLKGAEDRVLELCRLPQAAPQEVPSGDWVRLDAHGMTVTLPPETALLIECSWSKDAPR